MGGYGYAVVIDHGNGLSTLYGHNSELAVDEGQSVAKGQVISYAGSTGNSTGPHCHFEVRVTWGSSRSYGLFIELNNNFKRIGYALINIYLRPSLCCGSYFGIFLDRLWVYHDLS